MATAKSKKKAKKSQTSSASNESSNSKTAPVSKASQISKKSQTILKKAQIAANSAKTLSANITQNAKNTKEYTPLEYTTTEQIPVSQTIIDTIIGQEHAVEIIKKAAHQRRHVLLIGEPGTGKSMLGMALAQMLPKEKLVDILAFQNPNDENQPFIRVMPAGEGRKLANRVKVESQVSGKATNIVIFIVFILLTLLPWWAWRQGSLPDVVYATSLIASMILFVGLILMMNMNRKMGSKLSTPKVVVDNAENKQAPFLDATGSHAGALLGDVLHDPFQSGGLGTPAHERVVGGMIHKANMGVLFIDEVATLAITSQQELLTALQEGKFAITGQSERSAGAMVRTEPVPCNFILVAAGNLDSVEHMHPALRSRIRGYGYEVYMQSTMKDTPQNRDKIARFVAQEIVKDKKIPHFTKEAVAVIIEEARRRANRKGHLTLRLRELGGIIRAAGDNAKETNATLVEASHVRAIKHVAQSLEQQLANKIIENKKEYEVIQTTGSRVGRVNGLAVIGDGSSYSGIMLPIEASVVVSKKSTQQIIATGKLGDIAKEAVINVGGYIKRLFGSDVAQSDVYIQFLQTYEGVEGDSASIAIAVAVISSISGVPIRQDTAMTGSLSVRGTVLPIGGATYKIEAAIESGIKQVIIPQSNEQDVVIESEKLAKIKVIPVTTLSEVLEHTLEWDGKNRELLKKIKAL